MRQEVWFCAEVACNLCTHKWVAVWPKVGEEDPCNELACPACEKQDSEVLCYYGPDEKDAIQDLLKECGLVEYSPEDS